MDFLYLIFHACLTRARVIRFPLSADYSAVMCGALLETLVTWRLHRIGMTWGVILILFVHFIYIYLRYRCKLNSLILADLFVRRFEESCYRTRHSFTLSGYLSLGKWIHYFGLSHSTALVQRMFMSRMYWVINGARLLTELHRAQAATELWRLFGLCTYVTEELRIKYWKVFLLR